MPPGQTLLSMTAAKNTNRVEPISEIDVLWITAGLGCDGDTIAMTAATQPTLEEVLLGGIPGIPKVRLHNPVLSYENGDEFMDFFYRAAEGKIDPYILVIEGSIPNENNKSEGYWAAFVLLGCSGFPFLQRNGNTSVRFNRSRIETMLGFTQEEWLNDPVRWYEQIHPDDKARWSVEAAGHCRDAHRIWRYADR